jgi:hypothetical protein
MLTSTIPSQRPRQTLLLIGKRYFHDSRRAPDTPVPVKLGTRRLWIQARETRKLGHQAGSDI